MFYKFITEARKKILSISDMHLPFLPLYKRLIDQYPAEQWDIRACLGDFAEQYSIEDFTELAKLLRDYFHAIVPGNHELYTRNKTLTRFEVDKYLFNSMPFVGLNYYYRDRPRVESHIIVGDTALIGLCNFNMKEKALLDRDTTILSFEDSIRKAIRLTDMLRKTISYFVFLTHYDMVQGQTMAQVLLDNSSLGSDQFVVLTAHDHAIYPTTTMIDPLLPVVDAGSHFRAVGQTLIAQPGKDWTIATQTESFYEPQVLLPWYYQRVNHIKTYQDFFHVSPLAGKICDLLREDLNVDIVLKNAGTDRWSFTDDILMDPYTDTGSYAIAMEPFGEGIFCAKLTKAEVCEILEKDVQLLPNKPILDDADFQVKNHIHPSGVRYTVSYDAQLQRYVLDDVVFDEEKEIYTIAMPSGIVDILGLQKYFSFTSIIRENVMLDYESIEIALTEEVSAEVRSILIEAGVINEALLLQPKYVYRYRSLDELVRDLKLEWVEESTQALLWNAYSRPVHPPLRFFIKKWLDERRLHSDYIQADYISRKQIRSK